MTHERTIIGACDYSIATLKNMRQELMDYGNPKKEMNWAVGGIIITLTSHLLRICFETFNESMQSDGASAIKDVKAIRAKFDEFMDKMVIDD